MKLTSDWHIHSQNSCDGACMKVADLVRGAAERGIEDFGLTDHLHTLRTLPDIAAAREEFLSVEPSPRFHFGVEVSSMSRWELDEIAAGRREDAVYGLREGGPAGAEPALALTPEIVAEYGIEYAVGGTHWPLYVPLEREAVILDYHRQNMFLATHPLIDIVAHPWWWMGHWQDKDGNYHGEPWLDDFGAIPSSMHDEFAAAAMENDTAVEINIKAMLLNPRYPADFAPRYLEYLAELQAGGVRLSIGSDCHSEQYDTDFETAAAMIEKAGIQDDFWRLELRTES